MPLDGLMLHHILDEMQILKNGKITKIYQVSETEILFNIRAFNQNYQLIFSINSNYARLNLSEHEYFIDQNPTNFTFVLRKHLENGVILEINQHQNDRIALFKIKKINELGDLAIKYFIIELFNKDSNILITDDRFKIIDCLKKNFSLDTEKRRFTNNALYTFPEYGLKINPFLLDETSFNADLLSPINFIGLSNAFFLDLMKNPTYQNFKNLLFLKEPVITDNNGKKDLYCFSSAPKDHLVHFKNFQELLDSYYHDKSSSDRLNQKTHALMEFIHKKIISLDAKIIKLQNQLEENQNFDEYRIIGELILNHLYSPKIENNSLIANNYYTNTEITIPLDMKFSLKQNSENYFNKYRKKKNSIFHINEQISLATDEIEYFKNLENQLLHCSIEDALQMRDELIELKYLREKESSGKKKKNKIKILTFILDNGIEVMVGKNNTQNDYITNKMSNKEDYFFHIKEGPSSHVVCRSSELDEYTIRSCAKICCHFSKFNKSSSVPVIYTKIKFVSKMKSFRNSLVKYKFEKTIFIDPEDNFVDSLKKINHQ